MVLREDVVAVQKYLLSLLAVFLLAGCSQKENQSIQKEPIKDPVVHLYQTTAPQITTIGNDLVTIDLSNTSQGYLMVCYHGENHKVKARLYPPNSDEPYTYDKQDDYEAFPLTGGDGTYKIEVYENISDTKYATIFSDTFEVNLENPFLPFLYPSQYVNYYEGLEIIDIASELGSYCENELQLVQSIYHYVIDYLSYDDDKAKSIQDGGLKGYLPDIQKVYDTKKGICFDYAALISTMLRTQNIPTKMEIGYALNKQDPAKSIYHAWISVYIKDVGWIDDIIQFDGKNWRMLDPTFASNSDSKKTKDYISDASNYQTKYCY